MFHGKAIKHGRRHAGVLLGAALLAVSIPIGIAGAPSAVAASGDTISIDAGHSLGAVPSTGVGLNTAVYDGHMNDGAIPGLLKSAGIGALRYPGGSYSDIYNWQTNTAQGGSVGANTNFADFMKTAKATGANPVITLNYGTGTPALAAAWVKNADVTNHYGIDYWEVGNEVYGNGTYGSGWEADGHCTDASGHPVTIGHEPKQTYNCGPAKYASNVLSYISAIKAVDSNVHVCAVVTTPGFWPDNVTNSQTSPHSWNQTVLSALGSKTDCVIVHYYPGGSSAAGLLKDPTDIAGIVSTLHSEIQQYAKVNPAGVKVIVTETDSTIDLDTQPAALFAADMYMSWLENGITNVDWWNEHNGATRITTVGGARDYGDQGIFSNGTGGEPAANTPFAPYYAIQMLSKLSSPGETMVSSASNNGLIRTHAVLAPDGSLNVLIDNEDPSATHAVNLSYSNFTPSGSPTVFTLADNANKITTTAQSSTSSVTVKPYSLTVVRIP